MHAQALGLRPNRPLRLSFSFLLMPVQSASCLPLFGFSLLVLRSTVSLSCFFVLASPLPRFLSSFLFRSLMTNMLVGRRLSPGPSVTPESHMPAVVMGLNADWVLRVRSESGRRGEGRSMGDDGLSVEGRMTVGVGMTRTGGRGGASAAGVSGGDTVLTGVGGAMCLRRSISWLRLFSWSSSVSESVSTCEGMP